MVQAHGDSFDVAPPPLAVASSPETPPRSFEPPRRSLGQRRNLTLDLTTCQRVRDGLSPLAGQPASASSSSDWPAIVSPVDPGKKHRKFGPRSAQLRFAYQVGDVLGSGAMALVLQGTRRSDGGQVALKRIRTDDEELRQFTREEYELIRSLRHPSIVMVEALYEDAAAQWIVMEFCAGGSVEHCVERDGPFREDAARGFAVQLLQGVNYLHKKRIVHRDLKPANLLLHIGTQPEGFLLKIADFNSAKQIGRGPGSSLMLTDRGTHLYAAPELRFGCLWNERVDVWACGLCIYYFLLASLPFNITHRRISTLLLSGSLPPIDWGTVALPLKSLVQQCLIVRMQDRPPAMQLLLHPAFEDSASEQWWHIVDDQGTALYEEDDIQQDVFVFIPRCGFVAMAKRTPGKMKRQVSPKSPRAHMMSPRSLSSPLIAWGEQKKDYSEARWALSFSSLRHIAQRKSLGAS